MVEVTTLRYTVKDDDSISDSELLNDLWQHIAIGNGSYDGMDVGVILKVMMKMKKKMKMI